MIHRRGFTLLELAMASAVLAVLMTATLQFLGWTLQQRQALDHRRQAAFEVANLLERFAGVPWPELTSATLSRTPLSAETLSRLADARLEIAVEELSAPRMKRIAVTLSWRDRFGERQAIQLSSWRAAPPEARS